MNKSSKKPSQNSPKKFSTKQRQEAVARYNKEMSSLKKTKKDKKAQQKQRRRQRQAEEQEREDTRRWLDDINKTPKFY